MECSGNGTINIIGAHGVELNTKVVDTSKGFSATSCPPNNEALDGECDYFNELGDQYFFSEFEALTDDATSVNCYYDISGTK